MGAAQQHFSASRPQAHSRELRVVATANDADALKTELKDFKQRMLGRPDKLCSVRRYRLGALLRYRIIDDETGPQDERVGATDLGWTSK